MSANPSIQLDLVRSSDRSTIFNLGAAKSRSWTPIFNQPGTFSMTLPLNSQASKLVRKWSTALMFTRDGKPTWSGPCTSITRQAKAGIMVCTFQGWLIELSRRFVRQDEETDLDFPDPGVAGGEILSTMLDVVNAQMDTDGNVRPTHLRMGMIGDTQVRIRSYKAGDNFLDKVNELISIENGFDIFVDPYTLEVSTRDPAAFTVRDGVKFGWGDGTAGNLEDVQETDDGISTANRENVQGANGGVISVDDPVAIETAGIMLEEWLSLSDISDPTILGAYANAELVYKRYGTQTFQITPKQYGNLPRIGTDWELGDQGSLDVNQESFQIDALGIRFFSATISYDDNGNEIISEIGLYAS